MNRIRLKIDITDVEYAERLSEYIKINGLNVFEITSQNEQAILCDFQNHDSDYMSLVCQEKQVTINKYQAPDRIMNEIVENLYDCNTKNLPKGVLHNKIVFVTSAHGGAGKSFIAQGLAICAAKTGKNILYISLDGLSVNDGVFCSEEEKDISIILHYANKQQGDLNAYIEMYKNHDVVHNVYYILSIYPSCDTFLDLDSAAYFIDCLHSNELYDYTFIDCPLFANPAYLDMMKCADETVLVKSKGSNREEQVTTFLVENQVNVVLACNMVRYTEGIYIPKVQEDLAHNQVAFYQAIEQILHDSEHDNAK